MTNTIQLIADTFSLSSVPGANRTDKDGTMKRYYLEVSPELLDNAKEIVERISGRKVSNAALLRNSLRFLIESVKLTQSSN